MQAAIFDFDGLIIDTESAVFEAWQDVCAQFEVELPLALYLDCVGSSYARFDPRDYLEQQLDRELDRDEITERHRARFSDRIEKLPLLPGVQERIGDAEGMSMKLAVASSSPRFWVEPQLARLGLLERFDLVRCRDDVSQVKPDPELYLSVLAALGVEAEGAIAFEDSPHGVRAALSSGILCVAVPNPITRGLVFEGAHLELESLAAGSLQELIARAVAGSRNPDSGS